MKISLQIEIDTEKDKNKVERLVALIEELNQLLRNDNGVS